MASRESEISVQQVWLDGGLMLHDEEVATKPYGMELYASST